MPTITLIQLLSGGACERRSPLKSTEDSANAVGVAPMALPQYLAMEVGTPWPKAVGLTGNFLTLPCQSTILQPLACGLGLSLLDLSGSPPNKLALIESRCVIAPGPPSGSGTPSFFSRLQA